MTDIWLISDMHLGHNNIIGYCDRPFKDAVEMDEVLVDNWNSVVKDGDKVYNLGDVYMGGSEGYIENILGRLKGQKRLILGNHDSGKDQILQRHFKKIDVWRMFPEFGLLLTHVPVHQSALRRGATGNEKNPKSLVNIHGHIHQNKPSEGPYLCVCVEQPHVNYKPIHIEDVVELTRKM